MKTTYQTQKPSALQKIPFFCCFFSILTIEKQKTLMDLILLLLLFASDVSSKIDIFGEASQNNLFWPKVVVYQYWPTSEDNERLLWEVP